MRLLMWIVIAVSIPDGLALYFGPYVVSIVGGVFYHIMYPRKFGAKPWGRTQRAARS